MGLETKVEGFGCRVLGFWVQDLGVVYRLWKVSKVGSEQDPKPSNPKRKALQPKTNP